MYLMVICNGPAGLQLVSTCHEFSNAFHSKYTTIDKTGPGSSAALLSYLKPVFRKTFVPAGSGPTMEKCSGWPAGSRFLV